MSATQILNQNLGCSMFSHQPYSPFVFYVAVIAICLYSVYIENDFNSKEGPEF